MSKTSNKVPFNDKSFYELIIYKNHKKSFDDLVGEFCISDNSNNQKSIVYDNIPLEQLNHFQFELTLKESIGKILREMQCCIKSEKYLSAIALSGTALESILSSFMITRISDTQTNVINEIQTVIQDMDLFASVQMILSAHFREYISEKEALIKKMHLSDLIKLNQRYLTDEASAYSKLLQSCRNYIHFGRMHTDEVLHFQESISALAVINHIIIQKVINSLLEAIID